MESGSVRYVERKIKRIAEEFGENCDGIITICPELSTLEFAKKNIHFTYDNSAAYDSFDITLTPYLIEPLEAWDFRGYRREVTVVAPEQTGKSLSWIIGLLRSMHYEPCLSLVVYPSDELAVKINQGKLEPLMKCLPKLNAELNLPHAKRKDSYKFSNLTCYFQGAGSRITSHSARIRICDEVDDWVDYEGRVKSIDDVRKRARSFKDSIMYSVCTPTKTSGTIWQEFLRSSQGYWHLRCEHCNELTMRSNDVFNLQWTLNSEDQIEAESIVLVCPQCKHEHKETSKRNLNLTGGYIHKFPDLIKTNPGFCWGALASQYDSLNWLTIAKLQMLAGKSGDIQDQYNFDNSIRGLPFIPRRIDGTLLDIAKQHVTDTIDSNTIEGIFYAGDTQDDVIYYVIGAIDKNHNIYIIENGKEKELENIRNIINNKYYNYQLIAAIQDEGGHRTLEIKRFVDTISNMWTYKGDNRQDRLPARSKTDKRLLLVREEIFRTKLLYYLYSQNKKDNNYLYFSDKLNDEFYEHITAYRKNDKVKHGDQYERWTHDGRKHDYFDCIKMLYAIIEFYKNNSIQSWYKKEAEWIKKSQEKSVKLKPRTQNFNITQHFGNFV